MARTSEYNRAAQQKHYAKNGDVIRAKAKAKAREKRAACPDYGRETVMRAKYGIGLVEVERMFADQGGVCLACGDEVSLIRGSDNYRHIDHNHALKKGDAGFIRGLLCGGCNCAAGHLYDSPNRARLLAAYLEDHSG